MYNTVIIKYDSEPTRPGRPNRKNSPSILHKGMLITGEIFKEYYPIKKLEISAEKDTKFCINTGRITQIGNSGYFNLDLKEYEGIFDLRFVENNDEHKTLNPMTIRIEYEI